MVVYTWPVPTVSISHTAPYWGCLGEREHLIVERQFHHGTNAEAVATACGDIGTPSARDRRGNAPRCKPCELLARDVDSSDAHLAARTS